VGINVLKTMIAKSYLTGTPQDFSTEMAQAVQALFMNAGVEVKQQEIKAKVEGLS
jgi:hypothetical protein